jgi:ADP-ribose pyrophosphatase YjhB (NUDIX family)
VEFARWEIRFGEALKDAAVREVREETGINAEVIELLDVSEVLLSERPYHSLTITYLARPVRGKLRAEADHPFGIKEPRWFSKDELGDILCHPEAVIRKAFRTV